MTVGGALEAVAKEVRLLSQALLQAERNPELFPPHVRRLRTIALEVRHDRAKRGFNQDSLNPDLLPLERAGRVVYGLYDSRSPHLFFLASRQPAGLDVHRLFLTALKQRGNPLLDYLARTDFSLLGVYPVESIAAPGVPFAVISRARLAFWRSIPI